MNFKKVLAGLLSISMIACFTACSDEDSSKAEDSKEAVTETVAAEADAEKAQEELEDMEQVAAEEAQQELEQAQAAEEYENQLSAEEEEAANAAAEEVIENYDAENPEESVLTILKSGFETSFGENMDVTYDEAETMYTVSVWQDGFAAALETEAGVEALNTLSDSLSTALQTMTDQVRLIDDDANITFNFLSDENQDDVLLTIVNGEMTYNSTK